MAMISEANGAATTKTSNRLTVEANSSKVVKKTKDRKRAKSFDAERIIGSIGLRTTEVHNSSDKEKRSQGIVIDGKTYTCATCKTGHRVGVCKHARERPMTATHPPGRPPAGAPKKVICDCPKQCSCKKKDCKCARKCSCTQPMYMLVYVPAPDETEDVEEEKGTWKLGEKVTTDLKGNVLTPEQVKARQQQKEAQKTQLGDSKTENMSAAITADIKSSILPGVEPKPLEMGNCCKHKENVVIRNSAADASLQSGNVSRAAVDGCNCGHTCACAFCPTHPNNQTSLNMARRQAIHFANHSHINDQSIVPFIPNMPQGASCMGGLPQFAVSRHASRPSFYDLQRTFPKPGYVIGYPIWSNRIDHAGLPVAPFQTQGQLIADMDIGVTNDMAHIQHIQATQIDEAHASLPAFEFSQDEFGIGNAFVTSAGPGDWGSNLTSSSMWSMDNTSSTPLVVDFLNPATLVDQTEGNANLPLSQYHNDPLEFSLSYGTLGEDNKYFDLAEASTAHVINENSQIQKSCCQPTTRQDLESDGNLMEAYLSPNSTSYSVISVQSDG